MDPGSPVRGITTVRLVSRTRTEEGALFQHLTHRRRRAATLRSVAASVLVHGALIAAALLAARRAGYTLFEDAGSPGGISLGSAGGGGGGGGGEVVTYVDIAPPAPVEAPPEETLVVPEPVPVPPVQEQPTAPQPEAPAPRPSTPAPSAGGAGSGGGSGTGTGGGTGEGTGTGVGPGSGSGTGGGQGSGVGTGVGPGTGAGKMQPPVPEMLLMPPPKPPRQLGGQTLVVRVSIDASGAVRDVEFRSTGDRGYDSRLRRVAMDWRFRPARDPSGRAVPVDYDVTLIF